MYLQKQDIFHGIFQRTRFGVQSAHKCMQNALVVLTISRMHVKKRNGTQARRRNYRPRGGLARYKKASSIIQGVDQVRPLSSDSTSKKKVSNDAARKPYGYCDAMRS